MSHSDGSLSSAAGVASLPPVLERRIVWTLSGGHLVNDMMSSIIVAISPLLLREYHLTFSEIGAVVLVANLFSSVSQPLFGWWSDRRAQTWMLATGVFVNCFGVAMLSLTHSYWAVLAAVAIAGLGSGGFHPQAARAAHLAAGNRRGLAQSIFQVGGNVGYSFGPLIVAVFLVHTGLRGSIWFLLFGVAAAGALFTVLRWYRRRIAIEKRSKRATPGEDRSLGLVLLTLMVAVRSWVQFGIIVFLPLYYIKERTLTTAGSEWLIFAFLLAGAFGTFIGGPLSDAIGKKKLLVITMLLAFPFAMLLPHVTGITASIVLICLGFVMLSSFAVGVVYGQELMPNRISLTSGLLIGTSVGAGGIGASVLGILADHYGLIAILRLIAWLPLLGVGLSLLLPKEVRYRRAADTSSS